jgi:hypothetical protein
MKSSFIFAPRRQSPAAGANPRATFVPGKQPGRALSKNKKPQAVED